MTLIDLYQWTLLLSSFVSFNIALAAVAAFVEVK